MKEQYLFPESADSAGAYAPDFRMEEWSERDRRYLEPFVTNPDELITILRNLPPELIGALCSRASRAKASLLRVLLQEYVYPIAEGEDRALAEELEQTIDLLRERGFKNILNNQRAQQFFTRWLSQYGDDSIAQMTGTHMVCWGISQVAMKFIEDQRIGLEPIEKSTRYVNFSAKTNGRYLYYIPQPDLERLGFLEDYRATLDYYFDIYSALVPKLTAWLGQHYAESPSVLEKKAFDSLRGLLPMATLGQVAFRGNAQAFEYLLARSLRHPLGELRWIAQTMRRELDKEIPSLLLRLDGAQSGAYQQYLVGKKRRVEEVVIQAESDTLAKTLQLPEPVSMPEVSCIEHDPDLEIKLAAAILFSGSHCSWKTLEKEVGRLGRGDLEGIIRAYARDRTARWQKIGRAFENSYLRFEIVMNIGAYRDLHRHRMLTQERQRFSVHHGYDMPAIVREAGLAEQFSSAMERAQKLFFQIEPHDPELAQYVVPLAYRMRFYQYENVRAFFWETELRTSPQGHPDYRFIEQEKFRIFTDIFPLFKELLFVDTGDYRVARRGEEERGERRAERIMEGLRKHNEKNT
ncbi:MAG: FAD-dependent thymidylate synthase [Parcubacteria group bacterium]|nr:FAD-dependent thymidylate synthase [Parcubacteria group bacterium]